MGRPSSQKHQWEITCRSFQDSPETQDFLRRPQSYHDEGEDQSPQTRKSTLVELSESNFVQPALTVSCCIGTCVHLGSDFDFLSSLRVDFLRRGSAVLALEAVVLISLSTVHTQDFDVYFKHIGKLEVCFLEVLIYSTIQFYLINFTN